MSRNGIRLIIFFILISGIVLGQAKILHSPPRDICLNSPIKIEAIIEGNTSEVERVRTFYRQVGQNAFIEEEMLKYMGVYTCIIPAEYVTVEGVEYLIIAELADGYMVAFPEVDPYNVPMFLSVKKSNGTTPKIEPGLTDIQDGLQGDIIILSPEEGESIAAEEVVLAFSLFNTPDVALETVRLDLDNISILNRIEISEELIIARPKKLNPGRHTAKLNLKNQHGVPFATVVVNFTVVRSIEEARRIVKYTGRVSADAGSEQIRGVRQNINSLRSNVSGSYDWLRFNAKTFVTSQEAPDRQPRNRLTAGFKTAMFDLTMGDVNPQFSEFGLRGKRVRGFEADLKLKYFNTHVVYGQTERATVGEISNIPDTLSDGLQYSRTGYVYDRNLLAVRPYLGSGQNFQFGLSVIKARDDTLSVKREYGGITQIGDKSIIFGGNKPKDNIVLGTDLLVAFDSKRFVWQTDFAFSYLNRDISNGPLTLEDLDTFMPEDSLKNDTLTLGDWNIALNDVPFDPGDFARYFIINKNVSPWAPIIPDTNGVIGLKEFLNMPSTAFKTSLKLNYFNNYFVIGYQRVGPEFSSLGNPYLRNDVQGFNVSDKIRLFNNKVFITLAYDQKKDNLIRDKNTTTTTSSFNAGIALNPGDGLPTINFNTMQYGLKNDLDIEDIDTTFNYDPVVADSLVSIFYKDQRKSNMTIRQDFRISHNVAVGPTQNTINITYANSERSDRITDRIPEYRFNATSTSMLSFGLNTTFQFPLKTNVKFTTNTTKSSMASDPYELMTVLLKGRYELFDSKLVTELGWVLTTGSGMIDFTKNNVFTGATYRLLKMHQFRWRLSYSLLNDRLSGDLFNDLSFQINYTLIF
ncbi:MAG TPA: hypothetical protein DHW42_00575 [Candidatus Marinimicrobia bacterium]|nr:hypothetical protein [Candidatus Neomarinimicrobiota bacterium]